ncbi:alanine--glyoxylate aminotransferase family protein [Synechococcus sp. CS-602]|uniref:pyridoxal-phosphate-dependent aminotransferase family protein n=1 Tax=Synechococcaceae TaxID=1890426 RepID=UPI0008FF248B|nr:MULTISPECIES: alanine--glyoxylate aminotransferase family protein [Synechococcaceae]MCT4364824.1 alanine--glyoxylate aminotransferase family protein [Candidatus Regnicoccus frigidus MAG-AL1]APD48112.1 class V aminotransferase [Synechococcus sp. SynAce01]MCT0203328.1 alanine--glyoxylate aminotransferase family protein [Synechococcus sp. CS-603]MCT0203976.1 alanine--glyoxylate aminotransferase family protein [Synechococcus sp. CS-602]MCT0246548.1 alanine--glyoxylate aminotransferase family pr
MQDKLTLMIPGPTPVPESVLLAMSRHPIGHRSAEFQAIVQRTTAQLKWLHQTEADVLALTGSGTAAMEAGIINVLSTGDKVLCGDNGKFGERWVKVARAYGLEVEVIEAEWGQPLDPEAFRTALEADTDKRIRAVILTHSETSTGVINDLETIARHVHAHGQALVVADCVTSLGACNVPMDAWGLDVVGSGSQKGYMMPPGLGFVAMSQRAWKAQERSNLPKFYFNLATYRKAAAKDSNPFTPPVNLYFALEAALEMMQAEGLEAIFARHARHRRAAQAGMKGIGLALYAADGHGSPSITAVAPEGIDAEILRKAVKERFDILLAGGQDHLKGKVFRIGHLGFVCDRDLLTAVAAIEATVAALGLAKGAAGAGVAAAAVELAKG